jgi:hypothetical protein
MVLEPIAKVALAAEDQAKRRLRRVLHAHPDARADARPRPHNITWRPAHHGAQEFKELYSTIEEAKADISASSRCSSSSIAEARQAVRADDVHDLSGVDVSARFASASTRRTAAASRSSSITSSTRRRHGRADGTFAVIAARIKQNVIDLTRDIMTMQATGDYAAAKQMMRAGVVRPPVQAVLDKLKHVPVDIEQRFVTADSLSK